MTAPPDTVAIAGAGIAGLALAGALRARGRTVTVFEERPSVATTGAGITLWPNALAALDTLGLGDRVRDSAAPVSVGRLRDHTGKELRALSPDAFAAALGEPMRAIARPRLIALLATGVSEDVIRFGCPVTGYRNNDDGSVTVTSACGGTERFGALIGADGYRSAVLRARGGRIRESYAGYTAWRGIADVECAETGQALGPRAEFGVVPLPDGRTYWFATMAAPEGAEPGPGGDLDMLRAHFGSWHPRIDEVLAACTPGNVARNDIYDRTSPRRWTDSAVTLIGDAAHAMRPHLGQGGCQALVDAAVLAAELRGVDDPRDAFVAYERRRRRTAGRVRRESEIAGRLLNLHGPVGPVLNRAMTRLPERFFLSHLRSIAGSDSTDLT